MSEIFATPRPESPKESYTLAKDNFGVEGRLDHSDAPVSLYESANQKPYISELVDAKLLEHSPKNMERMGAINKFILNEMKELSYGDTKEGYRSVLNSLMRRYGINKNESSESKITKLAMNILIKKIK
jgi:hypothetical protein